MPYARTSQLPSAVRSALPFAAQDQFMAVVNSQLERGLSEGRAFASAWSTLRRSGWRPPSDDDGQKWQKAAKRSMPKKGDLLELESDNVSDKGPATGKIAMYLPEVGQHGAVVVMFDEPVAFELDAIWDKVRRSETPKGKTLWTIGKRSSYSPPQVARNNARRALEVREEKPDSQRGMTSVGLARARDLANGRPVSVDTLRRMVSFFERHEVDKEGSTWGEKGKGWQAWHGWGGDAAWRWARGILSRLDKEG